MTNSIQSLQRQTLINPSSVERERTGGVEATPHTVSPEAFKSNALTRSTSSSVEAFSSSKMADQLKLSETAQRSLIDPTFDRQKVEAIKSALREGNYPLDSKRIAESFLSLEKMLSN
jgi:negative regulator of flagellin synthesis FlgM